jgi:hypothetical protein
MKFDWRLPVFLVVIQIAAIAVQWGVMSERIDSEARKQEQQDRHMEAIDNELKERRLEAGEVGEFRRETIRRFDALDRKLDSKH